MNSKVEKFWNKQTVIPIYATINDEKLISWKAHLKDGSCIKIAFKSPYSNNIDYIFDNKIYSEEDALKVIKLLVFA